MSDDINPAPIPETYESPDGYGGLLTHATLLDTATTARHLGISRSSVEKHAEAGDYRGAFQVGGTGRGGGQWRIPATAVNAILTGRDQPDPPPLTSWARSRDPQPTPDRPLPAVHRPQPPAVRDAAATVADETGTVRARLAAAFTIDGVGRVHVTTSGDQVQLTAAFPGSDLTLRLTPEQAAVLARHLVDAVLAIPGAAPDDRRHVTTWSTP